MTAKIDLDIRAGWSGEIEALVHQHDGAQVSRNTLGGAADLPIDDGDTITLVFHSTDGLWIDSFTDVDRGDTLHVTADSDQFQSVGVHLPTCSGCTWDVRTPDGSATGAGDAITLPINVPVGRETTPIVATALASDGGVSLFGDAEAPVRPDGIAVYPLDTVAISAAAFGALNPNKQALVGAVVVGDEETWLPYAPGAVVTMPAGLGDAFEISATTWDAPTTVEVGAVASKLPTGAVVLDLSAPVLPAISNGQVASSAVSWTATGGGEYDLVWAFLDASSATRTYSWDIAGPGGTTTLALPVLPADLAPPGPFVTAEIKTEERSDVVGYHELLGALGRPSDGERFQVRYDTILQSPSAVVPPARHEVVSRSRL